MGYKEPTAEILDLQNLKDGLLVILRVDKILPLPLAPGGLYSLSDPKKKVLELHKLLNQGEEGNLIFKTYESPMELPPKGGKFIFRAWWTPNALDIVTNMSLTWTREKYPGNGDHDHCLLTYKTISAYTGEREGYCSGKAWISVEGYERFIRDDILRLRHRKGEA